MGLPLFSGSSGCDDATRALKPRVPGDPNPYRFEIIDVHDCDGAIVAIVKYPDCTTYEGVKVLVYEDAAAFERVRGGPMDPHFLPGASSPLARFAPTLRGIELALAFAHALPAMRAGAEAARKEGSTPP